MFMNKYGSVKNIDVEGATEFIKDHKPLILDVRSPQEYEAGHINDSRNTPLPGMENFALDLEEYKDKVILVYCHSGMRSARASEILAQKGFNKVYNLTQGIALWAAMGLEIVK